MTNNLVRDSVTHTMVYDPESDTDNKSLDDKVEDFPPLSSDPVQRSGVLSLFQRKKYKTNSNNIATQPSVFDTAEAKYFEPSPNYENRHRFDSLFRWTWGEQTKVTRKTDFNILPWVGLLFIFVTNKLLMVKSVCFCSLLLISTVQILRMQRRTTFWTIWVYRNQIITWDRRCQRLDF